MGNGDAIPGGSAAPGPDKARAFDYRAELTRISITLPLFATVELEQLEEQLSLAETMGPFVDPTKYMRGGAENLAAQRELLCAAAPMIRLARQYRDTGLIPS